MQTDQPKTIRLADYRPPAFLVDSVELTFDLDDHRTAVTTIMKMRRNEAFGDSGSPLELDGEDLDLQDITIDGWQVAETSLTVTEAGLTVENVPDQFLSLIHI